MATLYLRRLHQSSLLLRQMYIHEAMVTTSNFSYLTSSNFGSIKCSMLKLQKPSPEVFCVEFCKYSKNTEVKENSPEKLSLLKRFKQMYRDYWYVLVPVHLVTSAAWFGGFYYLAKSGVDIAGILESWNVSEKLTNTFKDSSMGYIAVAYALYKLATPVRYTVTLGGTTISIKYLKELGYIKPVPSADQLKEMYKEGRENIMGSIRGRKDFYKDKKDSFMRENIDLKLQKDKFEDQEDILVKELKGNLNKIKKGKTNLKSKTENLIEVSKKEDSR